MKHLMYKIQCTNEKSYFELAAHIIAAAAIPDFVQPVRSYTIASRIVLHPI